MLLQNVIINGKPFTVTDTLKKNNLSGAGGMNYLFSYLLIGLSFCRTGLIQIKK